MATVPFPQLSKASKGGGNQWRVCLHSSTPTLHNNNMTATMMEAPPSQAAAAAAVATTPIVLLTLFFFFVVYQILIARPRSKGGVAGPPLVTTSPVCAIPFVGTMVEFGRSPVKMVARCHERYGPVFTVPVSV